MYNGVYTAEQYAFVHDTLIKWLSLKLQGKSLGETLKERGVKNVAIYGINDFGHMVYEDVRNILSVNGFVDRRAESEKLEINGIKVFSPAETRQFAGDCYLLITPEYYFREISEQLMEYGIGEDRIISIAMAVS